MSGVRLVAAAATAALRQARFGGGGDLDEGGLRAAHALAGALPPGALPAGAPWWCAPSAAARRTAAALGATARDVAALADPDAGRWAGRTLTEVAAAEPDALAVWLRDPHAAPGGGESLAAVRDRVGAWLDTLDGSPAVAVAHPVTVRAALAHALALPADGVWRLDVAPLAVLRLTRTAGRWHLHLPAPR